MNSNTHITNAPLPPDQNFRVLKQLGLDYVQQHCDREWTNLNPSDPGITILDQLCYALTELGYCSNFPIEDILASQDGSIEMKNRFYQPGEILTTAPVTINDYRRYLVDGVDGVTNAVIIPSTHPFTGSNLYRVYLQLAAAVVHDTTTATNICKAAFYYLNKSRNIGELFATPEPLQPLIYTLPAARIDISDSEKVYDLLKALHDTICNFIFPVLTPPDYLQEDYNGPLLQHGAISDELLGTRRDTLYATDIVLLAESITGILKLTIDSFGPVRAESYQLIMIDLPSSIDKGLQVWCNGNPLQVSSARLRQVLNGAAENTTNAWFDINAEKEPILPTGQWRDIASYYSIQHTFPDIFAVGANAVNENASPFQVAQSRQLKGYLTLYDQVMANEFAQLAGVGKLFSFSNTETGHWGGVDAASEKAYPSGYLSFSPTYFFQDLYQVPNIRPLLKGNEIFNFSEVGPEAEEQAHKSWLAYQADPYNPYIRGLMDSVEETAENLERRNNILNHLLARHGESPAIIDAYAEAAVYTGNRQQGMIIIKSLYLQNLGLLSYHRQRAYNYIGATKLDGTLQNVPATGGKEILNGNSNNFIFEIKAVEQEEKLYPKHFILFTALELKLNLLFALRVRYRQFIATHYGEPTWEPEVQIAWWLCQQRRGMVLIEEALLLQSLTEQPTSFSGNGILLFLPDFLFPVDQLFRDRLYYFLQQELPVQVPYQCYFLNREMMQLFIPAYSAWHNSLVYKEQDADPQLATTLIALLNKTRSYHG